MDMDFAGGIMIPSLYLPKQYDKFYTKLNIQAYIMSVIHDILGRALFKPPASIIYVKMS
jgi:hypothetical protein